MRFSQSTTLDARRLVAERSDRLRDFISGWVMAVAADSVGAGCEREVLLLARASDSPVVASTLALRNELIAIGASVRAVVLGPSAQAEDEEHLRTHLGQSRTGQSRTGQSNGDPAFGLTLRIARHPRLIEAHEQLVLGTSSVWYGDSMRRAPLKRDAFEAFSAGDQAAAKLARQAFDRLWQLGTPYPLQG